MKKQTKLSAVVEFVTNFLFLFIIIGLPLKIIELFEPHFFITFVAGGFCFLLFTKYYNNILEPSGLRLQAMLRGQC